MNDRDDCGCCEGWDAAAPSPPANRPGLSAIAYRVGTHSWFKRAMLARLSAADLPALAGLTSRADDDFAVALLDAWAVVADVLTFYQERIANESYLGTATERASVVHLARLIGYELRPGVAATAHLAFTLDDVPGSPRRVPIPAGARVQSIPGPDERPQTFETAGGIEARAAWNALRPRPTELRIPAAGDTETYLKGSVTGLSPGDRLLFVSRERDASRDAGPWAFRRVTAVEPNTSAGFTRVVWETPLDGTFPNVYALLRRASAFGYNAPQWRALPTELRRELATPTGGPPPAALPDEWPDFNIFPKGLPAGSQVPQDALDLDSLYPDIRPDSWLVLSVDTPEGSATPAPPAPELFRVQRIAEVGLADFTLAGKATRITVGTTINKKFNTVRNLAVFARPERLTLAEAPVRGPLAGDRVTLSRRADDLAPGQPLAVTGRDDDTDEPAGEVATLLRAQPEGEGTTLVFERPLRHAYRHDTAVLNANVAPATHGETVQEVLGGGDAARPFQHFVLRQGPLTYVRAPTARGAESTLRVWVGGVEWHEVPTLLGYGPRDRVFVTRTGADGRTVVRFGDGQTGARLPTGPENVRATYRKGVGREGIVAAGQLSLPLTRPLGLRGVSNPEPSADAADPEPLEEARHNAPLAVRSLGRVVSLRDYEDFARAYAGVAKAAAARECGATAPAVVVTVAGAGGATVEVGGALHLNLLAALRQAGDPRVAVRLRSYRPVSFRVAAGITVDPDHQVGSVLAAVKDALRARFGFAARGLGQSVTLGEVIAAIQAVPGVVAVDVDRLERVPPSGAARGPGARLAAADVELLTLEPGPLDGIEVKP